MDFEVGHLAIFRASGLRYKHIYLGSIEAVVVVDVMYQMMVVVLRMFIRLIRLLVRDSIAKP